MPQVQNSLRDGFSPEQWATLRQPLRRDEFDIFLEHVFANLARRPEPLRLREVAAVVRRISQIVDQGVPRDVLAAGADAITKFHVAGRPQKDWQLSRNAQRIGEILLGKLMSFGEFADCSTKEALHFVQRNATHLASPYLEPAVEFLERYDLPPDPPNPFRAPCMLSPSQSGLIGRPNPWLTDDLSQRICGANHALKQAGLHKRFPLIASALNKAKLAKRSGEQWEGGDVSQRVKEYEAAQKRNELDITKVRTDLANWCVSSFRFAQLVNELNHAIQQPVE
jgi:hypothetical protein